MPARRSRTPVPIREHGVVGMKSMVSPASSATSDSPPRATKDERQATDCE